jgi:hypothetical protein
MAGLSRPKNGVAPARLCPAIDVSAALRQSKTWMPGSSRGMTSERFVLILVGVIAWH